MSGAAETALRYSSFRWFVREIKEKSGILPFPEPLIVIKPAKIITFASNKKYKPL